MKGFNMSSLTTIDALNNDDAASFVAIMAEVFEHAPWVAQSVTVDRPFASADALHAAMMAKVAALSETELVKLFAGHPELAGLDARSGKMTSDSILEQGKLALHNLAQEQAAHWDALNKQYRERFGFPFIICVSRHTRLSILKNFESRLINTRSTELATAMNEIGHITRLRLASRIADHGMSHITGVLSTHVLDTSKGCPAAGMRFTLCEMSEDDSKKHLLVDAVTDERGRTSKPLLAGEPLRIGRYELRFHVGEYFRRTGVIQSDWPFLDIVPVLFSIDNPVGNYHVPLTVTPWAYSTYRGQ
jgi:2-oxo-4-hydroxy-4-carboxy-5-ureidoimidazoline decarboxylase